MVERTAVNQNVSQESGNSMQTDKRNKGRGFFWAAFWTGIATHAVEIYWMMAGIRQMAEGACTASLISLWFGLPVVFITVIFFALGSYFAGKSEPKAWRHGMLGVILSCSAIPLWLMVAVVTAFVFSLG